MWHLIKAYISFLIKSKNQYGVHSPFVYELITKCFYDKRHQDSYPLIQKYRQSLLKNHHYIQVTDFGAGSRVFKSDKRKVSAIAKNAGITSKRAKLLNRLIPFLEITTALELGTSLGIGTAAMAIGNNNVQVTTVEGCPQTIEIAKNTFEVFELDTIHLINSNFEEVLATLSDHTFDLVYIDGNHQKEATLRYFETLLKNKHNDSVFIFDDIHWSVDMENAWKVIKKHSEVKVTIDTFQWGFVFFRKEQVKQDFIIRM